MGTAARQNSSAYQAEGMDSAAYYTSLENRLIYCMAGFLFSLPFPVCFYKDLFLFMWVCVSV